MCCLLSSPFPYLLFVLLLLRQVARPPYIIVFLQLLERQCVAASTRATFVIHTVRCSYMVPFVYVWNFTKVVARTAVLQLVLLPWIYLYYCHLSSQFKGSLQSLPVLGSTVVIPSWHALLVFCANVARCSFCSIPAPSCTATTVATILGWTLEP